MIIKKYKLTISQKTLIFVYLITSDIFSTEFCQSNVLLSDCDTIWDPGKTFEQNDIFSITSYPEYYYDACCLSYDFSDKCTQTYLCYTLGNSFILKNLRIGQFNPDIFINGKIDRSDIKNGNLNISMIDKQIKYGRKIDVNLIKANKFENTQTIQNDNINRTHCSSEFFRNPNENWFSKDCLCNGKSSQCLHLSKKTIWTMKKLDHKNNRIDDCGRICPYPEYSKIEYVFDKDDSNRKAIQKTDNQRSDSTSQNPISDDRYSELDDVTDKSNVKDKNNLDNVWKIVFGVGFLFLVGFGGGLIAHFMFKKWKKYKEVEINENWRNA